MTFTWPELWSIAESLPGALSARPRLLSSVCWLDVRARLAAVNPGEHLLVLRLHLEQRLTRTRGPYSVSVALEEENMGDTQISAVPPSVCSLAHPGDGWGAEATWAQRSSPPLTCSYDMQRWAPGWYDLPVAVVRSPNGGAAVNVHFWRHAGDWIGGVAVDAILMLPLHDKCAWPPLGLLAAEDGVVPGRVMQPASCV